MSRAASATPRPWPIQPWSTTSCSTVKTKRTYRPEQPAVQPLRAPRGEVGAFERLRRRAPRNSVHPCTAIAPEQRPSQIPASTPAIAARSPDAPRGRRGSRAVRAEVVSRTFTSFAKIFFLGAAELLAELVG